HLGRRSVTDFQRGMLALRKKEIVLARMKAQEEQSPSDNAESDVAVPVVKPTQSRQEIARLAGISSNAVVQIEKIQKAAAPELVQAVRDGTISISAAAAIASLPNEDQVAAVAGGRKELQQAARQVREKVREQKAPAKAVAAVSYEAAAPAAIEGRHDSASSSNTDELSSLRQQVMHLQTENSELQSQIAALKAQLAG
ncbi:MAG: plasmid replication/partition related protein, partial [Burkholderiales bacterium]|nr:plasmid replication/partition related protein [Burkholderiales bacterium]